MSKSYSELLKFKTFLDRFDYLKIGGSVGHATFGFDRHINQYFYQSQEWKKVREIVIIRDEGCDLGIPGYEIHSKILIHHINPMTSDDIVHGEEWIFNPEFLITTSHNTHNAIHYGDKNLLMLPKAPRSPGDTKLW